MSDNRISFRLSFLPANPATLDIRKCAELDLDAIAQELDKELSARVLWVEGFGKTTSERKLLLAQLTVDPEQEASE